MRRRLSRCVRSEAGFTMPELLVAMTTALIVAVAAFGLLAAVGRMQPEVSDRAAEISEARMMVERISRELRQGYGVESATPSRLVLLTWSGSCRTAAGQGAAECRVTYTCASGVCTRQAADPSGTYTGQVTELVSGLASDEVFESQPGYLGIEVTYPAARGDDAVTLTDGVALRNAPAA